MDIIPPRDVTILLLYCIYTTVLLNCIDVFFLVSKQKSLEEENGRRQTDAAARSVVRAGCFGVNDSCTGTRRRFQLRWAWFSTGQSGGRRYDTSRVRDRRDNGS